MLVPEAHLNTLPYLYFTLALFLLWQLQCDQTLATTSLSYPRSTNYSVLHTKRLCQWPFKRRGGDNVLLHRSCSGEAVCR